MTPGENYIRLKEKVVDVALQYGRDPKDITLLAVSKTFPWNIMQDVYTAGCRDFGESRTQELLEKIDSAPGDVRWHLVGSLQRNKVRKVIGKLHLIHSVDSLELAKKISEVGKEEQKITQVLLEVNASLEKTKHGLSIEECEKTFEEFIGFSFLRIKGLMTMAPLHASENQIRRFFASLRELKERLQTRYRGDVDLSELSMGMSSDFEWGIAEGATIVRIGTKIFFN